MKRFLVLIAAVAMIGFLTSESNAQRYYHSHGHSHNIRPVHRPINSGFSISIGNGFNGFSYSRGVPVGGFYGGYGYARPVIVNRPVYGGIGYGGYGFGPTYGGFYGGGYRRGCGGW